MGKIGTITVGLMFSGITMGLGGCQKESKFPQAEKILSEIVQDKNTEKTIISGWREGGIGLADAQSSIDSAAYRTIFESTEGIKDSAKVAEFNAIASRNKLPEYIRTDNAGSFYFYRKLRAKNLSLNEHKQINNYVGETKVSDSCKMARKQFVMDSIAYDNFFQKHSLKTDSIVRKIRVLSRKIKP